MKMRRILMVGAGLALMAACLPVLADAGFNACASFKSDAAPAPVDCQYAGSAVEIPRAGLHDAGFYPAAGTGAPSLSGPRLAVSPPPMLRWAAAWGGMVLALLSFGAMLYLVLTTIGSPRERTPGTS